jgi:hypothetical protein
LATEGLAGGWAKVLGGDRKQFDMFFDGMIDGFAYHKIVTDKTGILVDYVFLEVNHAFEKITDLKREQSKLFTPTFTTKSKGQGFGLAVIKRMTEALGGTVSFKSQEGKGTTFKIRVPPKKS